MSRMAAATGSAALEGADHGVRVNALVTGYVGSPLYRSLLGGPAEGELPGPAPSPTGRVALAIDGGCTA